MAIETKRRKKFDKWTTEFKNQVRRQERKDAFLRIVGYCIMGTSLFWDAIAQHAELQYSAGFSGMQVVGIIFGIVMVILGTL